MFMDTVDILHVSWIYPIMELTCHTALECMVIKALLFKPPLILGFLSPVCGGTENKIGLMSRGNGFFGGGP